MKKDNILALREKIDNTDEEILKLLDRRLGYVIQIGKEKIKKGSNIYHPDREKAILERLNQIPTTHLTTEAIKTIYQEIFAISRNFELRQRVAFLGPIGSYSHQAAQEKFGAMSEYLAMNNIHAVFEAVSLKRAKYGVVPLENNLNGIVGESIDLLVQSDVKIIAEVILPIHHCLASNEECLDTIKTIYSKDIAFGQCDSFLKAHHLIDIQWIPVDSTAKAAQLASKEKHTATICSKIAAKIYNLPIMFQNIENSSQNKTRFIIISDFENKPTTKDKTSVFITPKEWHKQGILLDILKDFNAFNINLTKIDSRPVKQNFEFGFYIDFEGHKDDANVQALFKKRGAELKWLGSYIREL